MKLIKETLIFLISILLLATWFCFQIYFSLDKPLIPKNGVSKIFIFSKGSTVKKAASDLQKQDLIKFPALFSLFVRFSGAEYKLKAGEYSIDPGMSLRNLVKKMIDGDVVQYSFTMVEGWNFEQIISALNSNDHITHSISGLTSAEIMEKIGRAGEYAEGKFAPDTYLFDKGTSDLDILITAYRLMHGWLQKEWNNRDNGVPYKCPYEALIVASLIEKETALIKEKPIIAGIILRRLKIGIPLQIDPTVIYGLGDKYTGKLTKADMQKKTRYNTYKYRGLPPTPIAMPGKDSIHAALHPASGNELYYVSKGDGSHEFSKSLKEQRVAIKKYLLKK